MSESLTKRDHDNLDALLRHLLDDFAAGTITRDQVVGTVAHVVTALDNGDYGEVRSWLEQGRKYVHR